jgi:acetyltransferase EpsM
MSGSFIAAAKALGREHPMVATNARNSSQRVILVGASNGQGRDVLDALLVAKYNVIGLLDDGNGFDGNPAPADVWQIPVLGPTDTWRSHAKPGVVFAIGIPNPAKRLEVAREMMDAGTELLTVLHPTATVSPRAKIGRGAVVLGGCVIAADATLGDVVILNARCTIDHDCVLEDAVQFGPGIALAGGVRVGSMANVGVGTAIMPGVKVGQGATIGAGSAVIREVAAGDVVAGNPAKVIKSAAGQKAKM